MAWSKGMVKVWAATLLLILGVGFVGAGDDSGAIAWAGLGFVLLLFVPLLIAEGAADIAEDRRDATRR